MLTHENFLATIRKYARAAAVQRHPLALPVPAAGARSRPRRSGGGLERRGACGLLERRPRQDRRRAGRDRTDPLPGRASDLREGPRRGRRTDGRRAGGSARAVRLGAGLRRARARRELRLPASCRDCHRRPVPDRGPARAEQGAAGVRPQAPDRARRRRAGRARAARVLRRLRRARARGLRADRELLGGTINTLDARQVRNGRQAAPRDRGLDQRATARS